MLQTKSKQFKNKLMEERNYYNLIPMQPVQTAVEWLVKELEKYYIKIDIENTVAFQRAKQMEKEQIKKSNMDGYLEGCSYLSINHTPKTTEQYYNETYNQNK